MKIDPTTIPGAIVLAAAIGGLTALAALGVVGADVVLVPISALGGVGAHAAATSRTQG